MNKLTLFFLTLLIALMFSIKVRGNENSLISIRIISLDPHDGTYTVIPPIGQKPYPLQKDMSLRSGYAISATGIVTYIYCGDLQAEFTSTQTQPLLKVTETCPSKIPNKKRTPQIKKGGTYALRKDGAFTPFLQIREPLGEISEGEFKRIHDDLEDSYALASGDFHYFNPDFETGIIVPLSGSGLVASYVSQDNLPFSGPHSTKYAEAIATVQAHGGEEKVFETANPFVMRTKNGAIYEVFNYFLVVYRKPNSSKIGHKVQLLSTNSKFFLIKDVLDEEKLPVDFVKRIRSALASRGYKSENSSNNWNNFDENAIMAFQREMGLSVTGKLTVETVGALGINL